MSCLRWDSIETLSVVGALATLLRLVLFLCLDQSPVFGRGRFLSRTRCGLLRSLFTLANLSSRSSTFRGILSARELGLASTGRVSVL